MEFIRIVDDQHVFEKPENHVKSIIDLELWKKSEGYLEYCSFIQIINESVRGTANSEITTFSENVSKIIDILTHFEDLIKEYPPIDQPQRFGNSAFRQWYQAMTSKTSELLSNVMAANKKGAVEELNCYLIESFGNATRIDYGTGHEMTFVLFLLCLCKLGFFQESDKKAICCNIFNKYMSIVRKLQLTYRMEPAGSHGVWSLDDYQFLPFIWGSSQLIGHNDIKPSKFLQADVVDQNATNYLFLQCIQFINQVKTGPFHEHSNQLWNISGIGDWQHINEGLIRMYKVEVLNKFPVIQHIRFGSLIQIKEHKPEVRPQRKKLPNAPLFHEVGGGSK